MRRRYDTLIIASAVCWLIAILGSIANRWWWAIPVEVGALVVLAACRRVVGKADAETQQLTEQLRRQQRNSGGN